MVIKMDYTELINAGTDIDALIKRLGDGEKMIGKLFAIFLKDKSLLPLSVYLPDVTEGCAGKTFAFALFSCIPSLIIFYIGKDILAEGISIGSADG